VSFSTVMPAVFESAELMQSLPFVGRFKKRWRVVDSARTRVGFFVTGLVMLALTLLWPRTCYPFVWISLALVLEAVNGTLGPNHSTLPRALDPGGRTPRGAC